MLVAVSIRFFLAGIFTLLFAVFTGSDPFRVNKKQWGQVLLMGLLSTTISYYFFNIGNVNIVSSINASIVGQSGIFFGVILSHFVYKDDRLNWRKCLALLVGFAGLAISQLTPGQGLSSLLRNISLQGEGFMLIHGVLFAAATMVGKAVASDLNSFVMTGWNLIFGSSMLCIVGFFMGGSLQNMHFTLTAFLILLVLALASAIPFSLWYWCTQYMPVSQLSMYKFIIPISGSLIAVCFGEHFTVTLAIGLVLVCAAIIFISLPGRQKQQKG